MLVSAGNSSASMIEVDVEKALDNFILSVRASWPLRSLTAIHGRSGAGKTTLINLISGMIKPTRGRIVVGGQVFSDVEKNIHLPPNKRRIGYVFQDARLFPHLTVKSNLLYGFKRSVGERRILPQDLIAQLGIGHLLMRRPHHLSGGEKQRVALGRALLSQPRLLLMDEPLASLDTVRRAELLLYIERLRDHYRIPTLYISHTLDEVLRLADDCLLIDEGQLVRCGPIQDVISDPTLSQYFGRFDASVVLECTVHDHDFPAHLSILHFAGGALKAPLVQQPIGSRARVCVRARDVFLARVKPEQLSAANILSGVVSGLVARDPSFVDVQIQVGATYLRALITQESASRLAITEGSEVWAVFNIAALDSRTIGFIQSEPQ